MSSDTSGSGGGELNDIADEMSEERVALLVEVARSGDDGITTRDLRKDVGIPRGSMDWHMGKLRDWNLVEVIGKEPEGSTIPKNIYDITEHGQDFLDRPGTQTFPTAEEVQHLRERVDELEVENEEMKDRFNELRNYVEQMV